MDKNQKHAGDIIDRYVYDVTRRLSLSQRGDIEKELRSLIDDMLTRRTTNAQAAVEDVEAVLTELGRPSLLAAKYREDKRYLIGPVYFDIYMLVIKIVLIATAGGLALSLIIGYIVSPPENVWRTIWTFFWTEFSALVQAFAWVTVVFVLIERFVKKDILDKEWKWKPSDLPPVPAEKTTIKKSESIFGIIFAVIALIIVNAAPEIIAIYNFGEAHTATPIFDLAVWRSMLPLIDIIICLGIAKEVAKLFAGAYTLRLAAVISVFNVIMIIVFAYVFLTPEIWNPYFCTTMYEIGLTSSVSNCSRIFLEVPKYLVGITAIGYFVDTIVTISKGIRNKKASV